MSLGTIGPLLVLTDHRPFGNCRKLEDALKMRLTRFLTNARSSRSSKSRYKLYLGTRSSRETLWGAERNCES